MNIPFVDLKANYNSIKSEIDSAIQAVIDKTTFIKGEYVENFEEKFAKHNKIKNCISCGNGTDAIYITLKALGVGPGDEVITVANSWISTAETISQTGAKPVFIDIYENFYTIDTTKIVEKINSKTKAIIPVHLFGHPAMMDDIVNICEKYNLFLIEDCAQAHFAEWKNKKVGTFGIAGTFSFFPGKNLGAFGDAGAIITDDDNFADRVRMFANHGQLVKHNHQIEGINSRLDSIQGAILSVKLRYIDKWNNLRIHAAKNYNTMLSSIDGIEIPHIDPHVKHVFHLYVIRVNNREKLIEHLKINNIVTGIHYPTPLPFLKPYKYLNHDEIDFPIANKYKNKILSLPIFPELTDQQIEYIVNIIKENFK